MSVSADAHEHISCHCRLLLLLPLPLPEFPEVMPAAFSRMRQQSVVFSAYGNGLDGDRSDEKACLFTGNAPHRRDHMRLTGCRSQKPN